MSSQFPNEAARANRDNEGEFEKKYSWIVRIVRDFGLPVAILAVLTWWLAVRVESRFNNLEEDIRLHQKFLHQICINTAPNEFRAGQCWTIQ